jgi:hypothetical protein
MCGVDSRDMKYEDRNTSDFFIYFGLLLRYSLSGGALTGDVDFS